MNLTNKYRPRQLADILGQDWIVHQLQLFVKAPHSAAFLFDGSTGVGKTSAAMVLAEALGVAVDQDEIGGLWQIASGEQTGQTVRRAVDNLRVRPWSGSGWKVLIVNECDHITDNAAMVWLDVLEALPPMTVVVFTTNNSAKIPARLRDRCEKFVFQSGGLLMRPVAQALVNKVWLAETGRTDAPDIDSLGAVADEHGDVSLRRVLQLLTPFVRAAHGPKFSVLDAFEPSPALDYMKQTCGMSLEQLKALPVSPSERNDRPIDVIELARAKGVQSKAMRASQSPNSERSSTLHQQALDLLATKPMSRAELKAALRREVGSTISNLLRKGLIERSGDGVYSRRGAT